MCVCRVGPKRHSGIEKEVGVAEQNLGGEGVGGLTTKNVTYFLLFTYFSRCLHHKKEMVEV